MYFLILISLLIGGMPIPEETMVPLYHIIANYPHLVISAMIGFIGAAIVGGLFGVVFGQFYFGILMALLISRHLSHSKQVTSYARTSELTIDVEEMILF